MTHWDQLSKHMPDLEKLSVLDLGSGKGGFLIEAAKHGAHAVGLELSEEYIQKANARAEEVGVSISVQQGRAEKMPFSDETFDFINMCEVIEHVDDPEQTLREVRRVLKKSGQVYISVPNRFGMRDQHFDLYGVNWLPRAFADAYINLFGKHKKYGDRTAGLQRLADMHYYTFGAFVCFAKHLGFQSVDIRAERIEKEMSGVKRYVMRAVYPLARIFYFDSFHILLEKS
jgi:SAM-dependent methyltransferase